MGVSLQFIHLGIFHEMIEELVTLSYFNVIDVDRDGLLNERDLSVGYVSLFSMQFFFLAIRIPANSQDVQTILCHSEATYGITFQK